MISLQSFFGGADRLAALIAAPTLTAGVMAGLNSHAMAQDVDAEHISTYLSARFDSLTNDYSTAVEQFALLSKTDSENAHLLKQLLDSAVLAGEVELAFSTADSLQRLGHSEFMIENVQFLSEIKAGRKHEASERISRSPDFFGLELRPVVSGWAQIAEGDIAGAAREFNNYSEETSALQIQFQHALALASIGEFEAAENIFADISTNSIHPALASAFAIARAQTLVQLERRDEALTMISAAKDKLPDVESAILDDLQQQIEARSPVDYSIVTNASEGIALYFAAAARQVAMREQQPSRWPVILGRFAQMLSPDNAYFAYYLGNHIRAKGALESALEIYDTIDRFDAVQPHAEHARISTLRQLERDEEVEAAFTELVAAFPESISVYAQMGNYALEKEDFASAVQSFDKAVQLVVDNAPDFIEDPNGAQYYSKNWQPYFGRAISRLRNDDWELAKEDFRFAVEHSNEDPYVLNYLGYSMLIQNEDYTEAEALIRKALDREPENAAIIDSMGWALFLRGEYELALPYLERAVRIAPNYGEVLDHLGDVYWKVGRKREAEFQWKRALSYDSIDLNLQRVRRKLEIGLDKVLEEEAAGKANY